MRFRFRVSMVAAILMIVGLLTAASLVSVYMASMRAAHSTAETLFGGIVQMAGQRIDREIGQTLHLAELGATQAGVDGIARSGLSAPVMPFLFAALAQNPTLYSLYYGYGNGDFLQLIPSRDDRRILDAHKAPAGTDWVLRTITREEGSPGRRRIQTWTFLDGAMAVIDRFHEYEPAYDPRQRLWYSAAMARQLPTLSAPYIFNSLQQPGITASHRLVGTDGVFGVDITLAGLESFVAGQTISENGRLVLFDQDERTLAATEGVGLDQPLKPLSQLDLPTAVDSSVGGGTRLMAGDTLVQVTHWEKGGGAIGIAVLAPVDDFTGNIRDMQREIALLALLGLFLLMPVTLVFSSRMAGTVQSLAADAERVRVMDFSGQEVPRSRIIEFDDLGQSFGLMKHALGRNTLALAEAEAKLSRIVDLGIAMAAERDVDRLMEMILLGAKELTGADGGTLYTVAPEGLVFQIVHNDTLNMALGGSGGGDVNLPPVPLFDADGRPNHRNVVSHAVYEEKTVLIDDAYDSTVFDFSGTKVFDERNGYRSKSFMTVPLKPRGGDVIGVLQLINARDAEGLTVSFSPQIQRFVEALAAQAATIMYNLQLLDEQERLMDAMVQLIAGAIDAKSPYTGGHCERVPELAVMLAETASAQTEGPFADFGFANEIEWREFRIGALLHDCGKVVTPEYVVDKATKLETLYNRIHEVRTRFEVLWRDAEIERLESIAAGADPDEAAVRRDRIRDRLKDEFAFIAECNIGGEFMAPDKLERLKSIATTTWVRNFDDRLGLSHDEMKLRGGEPDPLPAIETLLSDRDYHLIPRERGLHKAYADLGFKTQIPEYLYNRGEVYNLSIGRGTLTDEERFKINEHIMQTIAMLESLPLPKHLLRLPEYAGTHHETLTGTGYPRKLDASSLTVPARIMAIADIFEALTASDRPYKKAKTLSESVKILSFFKKDGHIDPDLFDLFLTSGVYRRYAETFLSPEQLDEVDIEPYLTKKA